MPTPFNLYEAVPPSDGLSLPGTADPFGAVHAIASHRLDGRCSAMYVVDAVTTPLLGVWKLPPHWQNTVVQATALQQARGVWHGHISWSPAPQAGATVGVVLCIVPAGQGIWRQRAPGSTLATLRGPTAVPTLHLQAIATAFEQQCKEPGAFGAVVLRS